MNPNQRAKALDELAEEVSNTLLTDCVDALKSLANDRIWDRALYESIRDEAVDLVHGTMQNVVMRRSEVQKLMDIASTILFDRAKLVGGNVVRATRQAEILRWMCNVYWESVVAVNGDGATGVIEEEQWHQLNAAFIEYDRLYAMDELPDRFEIPQELTGIIAMLREIRDQTRDEMRRFDLERREEQRQERIASHRHHDVVMPTRLCSKCGKKPAKVDDLCKRCAYAAGVMPHGKIGAA